MPFVLALASSHAPSVFCPAEQWPQIHKGLTRGVPQPLELAAETPDVLDQYVQRIESSLRTLRQQLNASQPDVLVIVGDDQREVFSTAFTPAMALFIGEQASGTTSISWIGQKPEDNHIKLSCHASLARFTLDALIERGFDMTFLEELRPLTKPAAGLGHAFTRLARALEVHTAGIPIIPLFLNSYHPPMPSAARCYTLGRALGDIFAARPERIAVLASGGLSHCPVGPRAGWVDEPLDRWVLDRLERGEGHALQHLFTFDSDTMRSGTGEIRSWITVAGAVQGQKATIVDYVPARHAVTGLGFAYWTFAS